MELCIWVWFLSILVILYSGVILIFSYSTFLPDCFLILMGYIDIIKVYLGGRHTYDV